MDSTILQMSPVALALVPLVLAITSLVKVYVDARWSPVVSLVLGVAGSFLVSAGSWQSMVLTGLMVGLTASGLYSGVKTVATKPAVTE